MQEDNKVELDIDDVKEEDVTVDAKPIEEKPEKVDVDLGYTDPIKKDTKSEITKETEQKETTEEKTQDNLQQVSDNVQKRIDQLTRKMREAERREKAALDYAKGYKKNTTQQIKNFQVLMIVTLKNLKLELMHKENR